MYTSPAAPMAATRDPPPTRRRRRGKTEGRAVEVRLEDPNGEVVFESGEWASRKERFFSFTPTVVGGTGHKLGLAHKESAPGAWGDALAASCGRGEAVAMVHLSCGMCWIAPMAVVSRQCRLRGPRDINGKEYKISVWRVSVYELTSLPRQKLAV